MERRSAIERPASFWGLDLRFKTPVNPMKIASVKKESAKNLIVLK
jgi:hypothetical protein